jgi:hypothetical protein
MESLHFDLTARIVVAAPYRRRQNHGIMVEIGYVNAHTHYYTYWCSRKKKRRTGTNWCTYAYRYSTEGFAYHIRWMS